MCDDEESKRAYAGARRKTLRLCGWQRGEGAPERKCGLRSFLTLTWFPAHDSQLCYATPHRSTLSHTTSHYAIPPAHYTTPAHPTPHYATPRFPDLRKSASVESITVQTPPPFGLLLATVSFTFSQAWQFSIVASPLLPPRWEGKICSKKSEL